MFELTFLGTLASVPSADRNHPGLLVLKVREKLIVVGDAETTDGLSDVVRDADVLVIEATFL
jgi:ribonuclease BN (tRNA processing enzyme)